MAPLLLALSLLCACQEKEVPPAPVDTHRTVAVTIDDLPVVRGGSLENRRALTARLLSKVTAYDIPAIGFVNEVKLGEPAASADEIALLEQWLDAGLDLGNHTYSHHSLFNTALDTFQADVVRGEQETTALLKKHGREMRYFRHPYLNTGPNLETKTAFEAFLAARGYTVAPVTIDNDEWVYAAAYDKAVGDTALRARIGADYIRYMDEVFAFHEQVSRELLGREPAQTLLIHANALNADYFDALARMMQARGYRFISLEEALQDPAYARQDTYTGRAGISWLQRWRITQGQEWLPGLDVPEWVDQVAFPERQ